MIKLTRVRTHPPIHKNFFGPARKKINLELLKKKRDGELEANSEKKWKSGFWKESKHQLLAESKDKCAYCESPTRVISYGDVEHFRPKSIYWWLAYSYENYLPSCTSCNQEYKKDFFELEDKTKQLKGIRITKTMKDAALEGLASSLTVDPVDDSQGKPLADFEKETKGEKSLLVNPYFDQPNEFFAYHPILETREVLIVPTKDKYAPVVKACEDLFGLNRKELKDLRFQWYAIYMTFRHTLEDAGISANTHQMTQNRIDEMLLDDAAYAGMTRYFHSVNLDQLPWTFNL